MKKIKLFLAAIAAMVTMGASAQTTWEGVSEITSGKSYYIVNNATGLFIAPGNNWGTRATLDESPAAPATVTLSNGKYTIVFTNPNGGNGLFVDADDGSSLFCDRNNQANYFWTITSNGDKTFNVQLASDQARYVEGSYLTAESGNIWANVQYNSSNETYRKWRFISVEDVKTTMVNSEETLNVSLLVHGAQGTNNIGASNNNFDRYKARYAWTFSGSNWKGQNNQTLVGFNNYWIECWSGSALTNRSASKTVSDLPAGHYKISAYTIGGDGVEWFAQIGSGDKVTAATTGNPPTQTSVELDLTETSNITLGIQSNSTTTVGWIAFDNVKMEYSSFRKFYLDKLAEANALATSLSGTVPTAVVTALNSTISTYTGVTSDYLSAISALNTAMGTANEAANTLGANYARYNSIKTAAKAISNDVDATSADAAVEAATTNSAINAAIVTLRAAFLAELPNVSIPNDPGYIDVTSVMVDNASVRQNTDYWTITGTPNSGYSWAVVSNEECEFYQQNFKFYQTLALTPGTWEFGVTGFHRAGNHNTNFYAGVDKILIPGVESSVVNTMAQAKTYFDGGNGKVALKFLIETAGNVEIGIDNQDTQTDKWTIFRDFTLKYYGAPDYTVYEDQWDALVAEATTAKTTYANSIGTELTALNAAIADSPENSNLKDTYLAKIEALQTALTAFNAAGPNYDALVREIAKAKALGMADADVDKYAATSSTTAATALANTQALMVDEYNYVTTNYSYAVALGTWNASDNAGTMTSQHWDGTSTSSYLEQGAGDKAYNLNSWTVTYNQDLALPAGNYVFKVAGRTATDHVTLTLNVTNVATNAVLGTVNDFPKGDTGLGINKTGATSFDAEDAAGFAYNGTGRGWQWRYVKFTLDEPATVNVGVVATADAQYRWMGFCNATVQTDNEANISLIAYNIALNDAKNAKNNQAYVNVTGQELTDLNTAIAADATLDKTNKTDIDAAKDDLEAATNAFTSAKGAYDAFEEAKAVVYENNLPYASATKFAAIATAQGATATSATDAMAKTDAIISAYRKYIESNALAEGVTCAENMTSLISDPNMDVTYDGTAHTFGAWQVFGQTDGTIQLLSGESFTDGSGKNDYKYADIYKSDNNAGIKQTISDLAPGKYMLTVTARAQATADATFGVFAGSNRTEITRLGNSGGVFDRGWNDASVEFYVTETSDVEIGVQSGNGKSLWWSATRFRLVKLADIQNVTIDEAATVAPTATTEPVNVTLTRTLYPDYWNTFCSPVAITAEEISATFGEGAQVREMNTSASVENNVIPFKDATSIAAGVPYLVKPTKTVTDPTFNGKTVVAKGQTVTIGDYKYIGILAKTTLAAPAANTETLDLYLSTAGTMKKPGASGANLKGMRAYFNVPAAAANSGVKLFIDGETDAIDMIDGEPVAGAAIYNIAGQRVNKAQKGIYIVNGKKVLVK